ncbi:MAG: bifunctional transcriptional activator/DNA repair enzyme AdaA [Acidimicrobiales bacterium]
MGQLDDARWRAVEGRDDRRAGVFVYGVNTTGVYCRPGCAARRPRRENVTFFPTPGAARAAGFRACRRCRPDASGEADPAVAAVVTACRRLESDGVASVVALAGELGYSERHLRRLFAEVVGVSIGGYARAVRSDRARAALRRGSSVTDAVADAGYGSYRAFYEHGAPRLGMAPGRYREGGRGERIAYTSVATPLGVVVAASTAAGVCSVRLGPDEAVLTKLLADEFRNALLERDDEGLRELALVLAGAVRGERDAGRLPLDVAGTAFQIRVWEALRRIPAGETRSYSQVALEIGAPRAVRAVGSACGANPVAIAVPCHRVVRRDGSLGGYRWGVAAKARLLAAEAAPVPEPAARPAPEKTAPPG